MTRDGRIQVEFDVHFEDGRHNRKTAVLGKKPQQPDIPEGNLPRVTRLMALAIRFEHLIRSGEIADYAEIARLGHVTRARVTQIMNLLLLAPEIQLEILDLPCVTNGRDPLTERDLRPIAAIVDWRKQRNVWARTRYRA